MSMAIRPLKRTKDSARELAKFLSLPATIKAVAMAPVRAEMSGLHGAREE